MSCNRCGQIASRCRCVSTCGAAPYYLDTPVCPEDHCAKIYVDQFNFAVCPEVAWNVPACGQTALVAVPGVLGASVGSYLWADTFGYFQITSVDADKGTLGITNNCTEGNAAPGTQIPACTCFVVTVPPVILPTTAICVAVSFTAPEIDVPTDITLTTTVGVTASDTIQIGSGFYFVESIKPNNVITIINKGSGITPGTPVIAYDANGEPQYCISIISSNPCDADSISDGRLLACDSNGVSAPLGDPCIQGYSPVVVDGDCNVEMQPIITPPICTHLTSPVNLVIGTETYDIAVESTASLVAFDILVISGIPNNRATVNTVTDGTHLNITISPDITTALTLPVGTLVCTINCCEALDLAISNLELQAAYQVSAAAVTPAVISSVTTANGNIADAGPYVNTGTNPMDYIATVEYIWSGNIDIDEDGAFQDLAITCIPQSAVVVGAAGTTAPPAPVTVTASILNTTAGATGDTVHNLWPTSTALTQQLIGSIPAGSELRVSARGVYGILVRPTAVNLNYAYISAKITTVLISS